MLALPQIPNAQKRAFVRLNASLRSLPPALLTLARVDSRPHATRPDCNSHLHLPTSPAPVKALIWFWLIDETLGTNLWL
jgi:hypothetical protein